MSIYKWFLKLGKKVNIERILIKRVGGWTKLFEYTLLVIILFLLSGGMVTSFTGGRSIGVTSQSAMDFMTFFLINTMFLVSVYLMYKGFLKGKTDAILIIVGMVMFVVLFIAEIYILGALYASR